MSDKKKNASQIPLPSELRLSQETLSRIIPVSFDNENTPSLFAPQNFSPVNFPPVNFSPIGNGNISPMNELPATPLPPGSIFPEAGFPGSSLLPFPSALSTQASPEPIDAPYAGALRINVVSAIGKRPIANAKVEITYTGEPDNVIESLTTDISGLTPIIELPAPPLEWSLNPLEEEQPYSEYNIQVIAIGYEPVYVSGSEIFADQLSLQPIRMNPLEVTEEDKKVVIIPAHTLFGEYPPKIPEDEIKPIAETGEIVLSQVVVPEYIIVHDGAPMDPTASNYWVRYKDYIKNVTSCEIYSTWPESSLYSNILAIQSFTLNRVYTEWYRKPYLFGSKIHPD